MGPVLFMRFTNLIFSNIFIKNEFHDIIHTFKIILLQCFSVFSCIQIGLNFFFFFFGGKGRGRENLFLFLNLSLRTVFKVSLPTNDTFNFPKTHPVIYLFNIIVEKIPYIMSLRIFLLFKANLRWQTHNWIDLIQ